MDFISKASIIENHTKDIDDIKTDFCKKITKALQSCFGNVIAINIPHDLPRETLDEIIADLEKAGWTVKKRNKLVGLSNVQMLNIS
ncbi:MAG: hypothetical protein COV00_00015 [Candidatus Tagabacteria bacterium CG10_big_fil_rev_8_21_14_0_10_40_13]|uniref:Uncharacterized protein n=2 Tax=Parcubacteria group TaxID=1794811 RepID=A0A2M7UH27_9BACT|nr:MAG: hypothetical protein AUJ33_02190 [Parcubacteria group bacterium CG1_02_40_25]PIZ70489.1 MAG: hypothetical protein COY09_02900 [Candidatus Portnoybacteria bacterium CG_4_10_14_0_2_um_filter_39_11]PJE73397.1 MAG: hypothetical protein COV00_00015 [Candidatus Tagabacteria bacterium CG10_big_fil_rev_8_21_14_0_10_40_13]